MNDNTAFETEYKTKQDAIIKKQTGASPSYVNIAQNWGKLKTEKKSSVTDAIKAVLKYAKHIELDEAEKADREEIKKAIAKPEDYKDAPTSKLDEPILTKLFGFTKDINDIILNDYGKSKNKSGFDKLMAHLTETGEGFDGGNKDAYKDAAEETKKDKAWETFISKGPEIVIKTIVNHEFEDKKQPLKEDIYKKGDDGEFDDAAVKLYLYEEKIGKSHQFLAKDEKQDEPGNGDGKEM
ncbi:19546_t:CDS:2, partial [Funneliformis geosporum]